MHPISSWFYHKAVGVPSKTVLEEAGELAFSVRDYTIFISEQGDDFTKNE
jgi:Mn-dependent DtxR family transcriptional regulator